MVTTLAVFLLGCNVALPADAQLAGRVVSAEGPMEGVVVSARKAGSPVTVSVVSAADGRYSFPGERLEAGSQALPLPAPRHEPEKSVSADIPNGPTGPLQPPGRTARRPNGPATHAAMP